MINIDSLKTNLTHVQTVLKEFYEAVPNRLELPQPALFTYNDKVSVLWRFDWKTEIYLIWSDADQKIVYRHDFVDEELPASAEYIAKSIVRILENT